MHAARVAPKLSIGQDAMIGGETTHVAEKLDGTLQRVVRGWHPDDIQRRTEDSLLAACQRRVGEGETNG